ncbi:Nitrogen permease reactivator protein [Coemansia interrupta]|uniref:non-specific serine/threonine protein kinase n=1 Tax=Coemansia interrupta TaxID=1126814 RepID=A0A9W8LL44_9FUNG|nr:Nitrogen permease reactivator protein [Coemansia interrupta]
MAIASSPPTPALTISSEPTILSASESEPPQEKRHRRQRSPQKTAALCTRLTLVTEPNNSTCASSLGCNPDEQPPATLDSERNAVDGTLSLSIRPSGWTKAVLGESIRRLGAGTGGHVDLHKSKITNKAIKTLQESPKEQGDSPLSLSGVLGRRVLEELGIAVNVRHENIVRTFEVVVETDRTCYVVMEACSVDLLSLVQGHMATHGTCMDDSVLNGYFAQLVNGVHYLHSIGVGHRDLKLDNICVTEQGVVKIVDFGCATLFRRRVQHQPPHADSRSEQHSQASGRCERQRAVSRTRAAPYSITRPPVTCASSGTEQQPHYIETLSSGICGSDPYMAPEVFTATHYAAAKTDIWALGIIYFAMRHLQFPWAVAHAARDARFKSFIDDRALFFEAWFPVTHSASTTTTWSSQTQFLATQKQTDNHKRSSGATPLPQARSILSRMLDPNPATRADIDRIRADPWFVSLVDKCPT